LFAEAWSRFEPIHFDREAVNQWRNIRGQKSCTVDFLGVWDTVKSYGGLRPVLLPHLRHNPIVKTVRHAIALDEKRGWFNVTTWGRLDGDRDKAMTRLDRRDVDGIEAQDILEVWFRGCHSDIGGGDAEEVTARLARRWMLAEAVHEGLAINADGERCLSSQLPDQSPEVHESLSRFWCLVDLIPRQDIDNSDVWPKRVKPKELHAHRHPEELLRDGAVSVHESVRHGGFARAVRVVQTRWAT
jgi:uncharacterized protein (DUF2235 family)